MEAFAPCMRGWRGYFGFCETPEVLIGLTRWVRDLWLMSTPCGKRGFFYETWECGGMEWTRVRVTAPECPRISKSFLEEQRSVVGLESFRQEHMCEFVGSGTGVFDRDLVEGALDESVKGLDV